MNKKTIVLDTNILLISIPSKSPYRPIFDGLLDHKYDLVITNEILSEYFEIISRKTTADIASNIAELLIVLNNVKKVDVYYKWNLIKQDPDDNKFVDCAIASGADYIVTNDQHFKILKNIEFPKVKIISVDDFLKMLANL